MQSCVLQPPVHPIGRQANGTPSVDRSVELSLFQDRRARRPG